MLAAALTAGVSHDPSRRITVLTDVELLSHLLPDGSSPEGLDPRGQALDGERLLVRDHTDEAVTEFERELLYRQRILAQYDPDSPDQVAEGTAMIAAMGLTMLITAAPSDRLARVRAVLDASDRLRLGAVLLGEAEHFTTIELNDNGAVTITAADLPTPLARMASLGARELADVLDMARAAAVVNEAPPLQDVAVDRPTPGDDEPSEPTGAGPTVLPAERRQTALLRLAVLGAPAVSTPNGPVSQITAGGYAVLAYLAAHPHGVTRDQALDELYPGIDTDPASQRFRTACKSIRSAFRSATRDDEQWFIIHDHGRYRLDAEVFDIDLWQMLAAIDRANQATTDPDALTALHAAVDAYHGEFADGVTKSWVIEYATTYRNQVINVLARIAEIQETAQPDSALAALERAVTLDPVCEELYQRIMRIQGRLGRVEAVRRTLERCTERLESIQTEPSVTTRRVADRQLRATAVTR